MALVITLRANGQVVRLVKVGGSCLFYAWAFEQKGAKSSHKFAAQDVLVPWHFRKPSAAKPSDPPEALDQAKRADRTAQTGPASDANGIDNGADNGLIVHDDNGSCACCHNKGEGVAAQGKEGVNELFAGCGILFDVLCNRGGRGGRAASGDGTHRPGGEVSGNNAVCSDAGGSPVPAYVDYNDVDDVVDNDVDNYVENDVDNDVENDVDNDVDNYVDGIDDGKDKPADEDEGEEDLVFHRYCHVYQEGELEQLFEAVPEVEVVDVRYDTGNWVVVVQKIRTL
jgi:hypothetical protein